MGILESAYLSVHVSVCLSIGIYKIHVMVNLCGEVLLQIFCYCVETFNLSQTSPGFYASAVQVF